MRYLLVLVALLVLVGDGIQKESPAPTPRSATVFSGASPGPTPLWPSRFIGANSIHLLDYVAYGWSIEKAIRSAKESGITVLRIYLDADLEAPGWPNVESLRPLGTNLEKRLEVWDRVLDIASKSDVRILAVFYDFQRGFGQPPDRQTYLDKHPYANIKDQRSREEFKRWIHKLVTRTNTVNAKIYRDDPTIMAWDIANEPRLRYLGQTCTEFQDWLQEISAYVKELDPQRPITVGVEDFLGGYTDTCLQSLNIPSLDFFSIHWYGSVAAQKRLGRLDAFVTRFLRLGKPVVMTEFGVATGRRPLPALPEAYIKAFKESVDRAFCAGASGFMFWGWGVPETRNWKPTERLIQPPHWMGEEHDITDTEFVNLIKNYKISDIGSC